MLSLTAHVLLLSALPPMEAREERFAIRVSLRGALAPLSPNTPVEEMPAAQEIKEAGAIKEVKNVPTATPPKAPTKAPPKAKKPAEKINPPKPNPAKKGTTEKATKEATTPAASTAGAVAPSASGAPASARPAASKASGGAVVDVSKLAVTKKISPEYPMISRKRKDEGTVTLIVTIKSGKVADVKVERGSGHPPLDESAIKAVRGWLFDSSGYGETITARIPFVFKLR
jgi:protein TonB